MHMSPFLEIPIEIPVEKPKLELNSKEQLTYEFGSNEDDRSFENSRSRSLSIGDTRSDNMSSDNDDKYGDAERDRPDSRQDDGQESRRGNRPDSRQDSISSDKSPLCFEFRDKEIPISHHSTISEDTITKAVLSRPFQNWREKTSRIVGSKCIDLNGVEIHSVHMLGDRVECINMTVDSDLKDEDDTIEDDAIRGICCLRDSSVGIFVELHCVEDDSLWSVLVDQPRVSVGAVSALELPVALLDDDGDSLVGPEAEEVKEACGLSLKQSNLINLSQRAYENNSIYNASGLCPSLGNCSEFIKIVYARKEITQANMKKLRKRLSQMREEGAQMTLRVLPLADIWKVSADMKVVCALFLLDRADLPERKKSNYYIEKESKGGVRKRFNTLLTMSKRSMFGQY